MVTFIPKPLTGSVVTSSVAIDLTIIGTTNWEHWPDYDYKSGVSSKISNFTVLGSGTAGTYSGNARSISWSDGAPTTSSSNNTSGNYIAGVGNGFSFTVPAETTSQMLTLYCGLYAGKGKLTAHLSDNSSSDNVDESINKRQQCGRCQLHHQLQSQ